MCARDPPGRYHARRRSRSAAMERCGPTDGPPNGQSIVDDPARTAQRVSQLTESVDSVGRYGVVELPHELERLAGALDDQPELAQVLVHDVALVEHEVGVAAEHRERAQRLAMQVAIVPHPDGLDAVAGAIATGRAADRRALLAVPHRVHEARTHVLHRLGVKDVALV